MGITIMLAGCGSKTTPDNGTELTPMQQTAMYVPRLGLAVRTDSRACVAIRNGNLAPSSPITLVIANSPQSYVPARIKAVAQEACPITKELDSTVTNYDLTLPGGPESLPKLTPLIAVVAGDGAGFTQNNLTVQADLDSNGQSKQFRACNSGDGEHLTVWSSVPLRSALIWHGFYYQPENTTGGPACTPAEINGG